MRILLLLFLAGCGGGFNLNTDEGGDVYLPIELKNRNVTVCKKVVDEEYYLNEVQCIELFSEKEYVISIEEWEKIKHSFGLYNHGEILSIANDKIQLCEKYPNICTKDPYKSLSDLENFIYKSGGK